MRALLFQGILHQQPFVGKRSKTRAELLQSTTTRCSMPTMNRLRELRQQAGLTAKQLGEDSGFAESTVTAWERSKRQIKPQPAGKLLDALKRHGIYATMDVLHGRAA